MKEQTKEQVISNINQIEDENKLGMIYFFLKGMCEVSEEKELRK